jgi:hypothetical protein
MNKNIASNPVSKFVEWIYPVESNGAVRVRVTADTFAKVKGFNQTVNPSLLPYTTIGSSTGQGIRVFSIDGAKVHSVFTRDEATNRPVTKFIMSKAEAELHLVDAPIAPRTRSTEVAAYDLDALLAV